MKPTLLFLALALVAGAAGDKRPNNDDVKAMTAIEGQLVVAGLGSGTGAVSVPIGEGAYGNIAPSTLAAGYFDDLEPAPCPDGIVGCLVAHWRKKVVVAPFPDNPLKGMVITPPAPLTTIWGQDYMIANPVIFKNSGVTLTKFSFVRIGPDDKDRYYEFGLRSDGCVVWREVK